LSVDSMVSGTNATRYLCKDNLWSFTQTGTHVFTYKTQYHLEVISTYGSPTGTDWYDEGATAYVRITTNMTSGPEGVRYVFVRWEGDASGEGMTSEPIIMDRPKKALAAWKTQYSLRVSYDPVELFSPSTLWFDAGSVADFSAPEGSAIADTRFVFSEWTGDVASTNPHVSLQMDAPKWITAKYKTQYLLSLHFTPARVGQTLGMSNITWYDAGQVVGLGPVPQLITVSSVERLALISWNVDGITQQGTSIEVTMDQSHHVELTYRTQYYLEVKSPIGQTTGSAWYFSGETARFGVVYSGSEFPVKYTLADWQSNPSTVVTTVGAFEAEVQVDRAYVVEAVWNADYTPAWVFLLVVGSAVTALVAVVMITVKRPGFFGRLGSSFKRGLERRKVRRPGAMPPYRGPLIECQSCGAKVPSSAEYCQYCGALRSRRSVAVPSEKEALDERVYEYIVKRHGEISLSRASRDLRVSIEELKDSTERLKKKGRLG